MAKDTHNPRDGRQFKIPKEFREGWDERDAVIKDGKELQRKFLVPSKAWEDWQEAHRNEIRSVDYLVQDYQKLKGEKDVRVRLAFKARPQVTLGALFKEKSPKAE